MVMPDSNLVCDPDRERADVGVSMAPADTALRAAGGPFWDALEAVDNGLMGSGVYIGPEPMLCLVVGAL